MTTGAAASPSTTKREEERTKAAKAAAKEGERLAAGRLTSINSTIGAYQAAVDAYQEKAVKAKTAANEGLGHEQPPTPNWVEARTCYNRALNLWQQAAATKVELTTVPDDEVKNVRAVAKEWLAANAALFGLFSLGGVIFGREVVPELGDTAQWIVPLAAITAIIAGATAILFGTKAAHGWPDKPGRGDFKLFKVIPLPFLRKRGYARTPKDPFRMWHCAVADLERAVWSAGVALFLLVVAVGTLWVDQAAAEPSPVETVKLMGANERTLACGKFAEVRDETFILLDDDGVEKPPIPVGDVKAVVGALCSGSD